MTPIDNRHGQLRRTNSSVVDAALKVVHAIRRAGNCSRRVIPAMGRAPPVPCYRGPPDLMAHIGGVSL